MALFPTLKTLNHKFNEEKSKIYQGNKRRKTAEWKEEKSRNEGGKLEMFDDVNLKTMIVVTDCWPLQGFEDLRWTARLSRRKWGEGLRFLLPAYFLELLLWKCTFFFEKNLVFRMIEGSSGESQGTGEAPSIRLTISRIFDRWRILLSLSSLSICLLFLWPNPLATMQDCSSSDGSPCVPLLHPVLLRLQHGQLLHNHHLPGMGLNILTYQT